MEIIAEKLFEALHPFLIAGLVLLGAIFSLMLYSSRDRLLKMFLRDKRQSGNWGDGRRSYDAEFAEILKRHEFLIKQLMDVIRANTEAMTGMKGVVESELKVCREDCNILHRRVDTLLQDWGKQGHAPA